jgi:hypothetical protein
MVDCLSNAFETELQCGNSVFLVLTLGLLVQCLCRKTKSPDSFVVNLCAHNAFIICRENAVSHVSYYATHKHMHL